MSRVRSQAGLDRRQRMLDLLLTVPGMVVMAPVLAGTAVLIRAKMGSPVMFAQERAGRDGALFTLYKFRTMTASVSGDFKPQDDALRLTPLGAALRRLSLDELPQVWNVLRGEMSLVGPRPLPAVYVDRYTETHRRRLEVRPGITGLAQVSGRNAIGWDEKFAIDVEYVDSRSVRLDLSILRRTILAVLRREGVSAEGEVTATEFMGRGVRP